MGLTPFLVALQFLTVLPVKLKQLPNDTIMGESLLYYPLVGLLIGLLLWVLGWLGNTIPVGLHAALILTGWVGLTGALHLDGLADSADAWIGGLGNRSKTLAIMKDPYCGPVAVVALVLLLLIKFTALESIITTDHWVILLLAPIFGRTALILLFLTTPYVRDNGLGSRLASHLPRCASWLMILFTLLAGSVLLGINIFGVLLTLMGGFLILRTLMLRRIGGATGDTAGALVEITETMVLVTAALM